MSRKLTTEEFIEKAKKIHGDKYDYSLVEYKNNKTKVKIICPEHGEFWQDPSDHLLGKGCGECSVNKRRLKEKGIIERFNKIHGNKYKYIFEEKYKNNKTKVKIICPVHGEFEQAVGDHLNGHGCHQCSVAKQTFSKEEFIERAKEIHGDCYDYSLVEYKRSRDKVKIICHVHGEFWQSPGHHLKGLGCIKCDHDNRKLGAEGFTKKAKEIHGDKYDYSLIEYKGNKVKVDIICPIHGEFWQSPNGHLRGSGCPVCNESQGEKKVRVFLENNDIEYISQKTFENCRGIIRKLPFDFYLPESNILIEFDGRHHFESDEYFGGEESFTKTKINDNIKNEYAEENNIDLLRIPYWRTDDLEDILEGAIF